MLCKSELPSLLPAASSTAGAADVHVALDRREMDLGARGSPHPSGCWFGLCWSWIYDPF